jgi:hypothetical protein
VVMIVPVGMIVRMQGVVVRHGNSLARRQGKIPRRLRPGSAASGSPPPARQPAKAGDF